jgi:hypothetical protein|tara:strand:- start:169 stop:348 length:180 start_codon:yes stop_codon:yes gene_type:complete
MKKYDHKIIEVIQYLVQLQTNIYNRSTTPIKNYDDREKIYTMFADLINEVGKYKEIKKG